MGYLFPAVKNDVLNEIWVFGPTATANSTHESLLLCQNVIKPVHCASP